MVAGGHPLSGRALRARRVYRCFGRLWLVVELPDGGEISVELEDTDVVDAGPVATTWSSTVVLTSGGARRLLGLLEACVKRTATAVVADGVGCGER